MELSYMKELTDGIVEPIMGWKCYDISCDYIGERQAYVARYKKIPGEIDNISPFNKRAKSLIITKDDKKMMICYNGTDYSFEFEEEKFTWKNFERDIKMSKMEMKLKKR
jgi:uncharacterized membrane protein YfhO